MERSSVVDQLALAEMLLDWFSKRMGTSLDGSAQNEYPNMATLGQNPGYSARFPVVIRRFRPVAGNQPNRFICALMRVAKEV